MPFKRKRATKKTKTKTVSRVKKSKLSIDDQLKETFQKYSEEGFIEGDNLLSFIEALSIEPDDLVLLVLMEQMECEDGVEIKWIEFERGMKKLHCTTVADIKNRLDGLRSTLALPDVFENIYKYAFKLNLQDNKKILDKDTAVALWELLLVGKFDLLEQWVEFVETRADVKFISKDANSSSPNPKLPLAKAWVAAPFNKLSMVTQTTARRPHSDTVNPPTTTP
jgi:hypothetical protein